MRNGFSLIELSIVLVILGLLAGGILAGQSLIRAAELRSITSEYQRYQAAGHTFRDKYMAIPGDMTNATRFWGRANTTADCVTNSSAAVNASTGTCDGDGDGRIFYGTTIGRTGEVFQFWRQLALAGLIEGNYDGMSGSAGLIDHNYGVNSPQSRISSVGWGASWANNAAGAQTNVFRYDYANSMTIGTDLNTWADGTFLKAEEAWGIDTKLDDGIPGIGKIHVYPVGLNCNNSANNTDYSATYKLNNTTSNACALIFRQ